jgi:hypothetical protein
LLTGHRRRRRQRGRDEAKRTSLGGESKSCVSLLRTSYIPYLICCGTHAISLTRIDRGTWPVNYPTCRYWSDSHGGSSAAAPCLCLSVASYPETEVLDAIPHLPACKNVMAWNLPHAMRDTPFQLLQLQIPFYKMSRFKLLISLLLLKV